MIGSSKLRKLLEDGNPAEIIQIEDKIGSGKNSTIYLNWHYLVNGKKIKKVRFEEDENVEIMAGIPDPNDIDDKRNGYRKGMSPGKLKLQVNNSGNFGVIHRLTAPVLTNKIQELIDNKTIKPKNTNIFGMIDDTYPEDLADPEKAGQPKPEPTFNVKIDFAPYGEKFPIATLRGVPKTMVLNYEKFKLVDDKRKYEPATVGNKILNFDNCHEFLTRTSIMKGGTEMSVDSVSCSMFGIATSWLVSTLIMEHHNPPDFTDDASYSKDALEKFKNPDAEVETADPEVAALANDIDNM